MEDETEGSPEKVHKTATPRLAAQADRRPALDAYERGTVNARPGFARSQQIEASDGRRCPQQRHCPDANLDRPGLSVARSVLAEAQRTVDPPVDQGAQA